MSRRRDISGLAATIAVLCSGAIAVPAAQACSCVAPDPETGYASFFEDADGAVIAKLVRIEPRGDGRTSTFTYRIREVFKRPNRFEAGERLRVLSSSDSASCGIGYPAGSTHGVFLYRSEGRFTSSLCSTTSKRQMREAAEIARDMDGPASRGEFTPDQAPLEPKPPDPRSLSANSTASTGSSCANWTTRS